MYDACGERRPPGAPVKAQKIPFAEGWPPAKNIVGNRLDFRKNLRSPQPRQAQLCAQLGVHFLRQGSSKFEKLAGAGDFKGQQFPPARVATPGAQVIERVMEARHILLRQIDAVARKINGHVLPKVGELERRANVVGKLKQVWIVIPEQFQHSRPTGFAEHVQ